MELVLNIYKKNQIEKTYTADTYDIMFGTVEDFVALLDEDALSKMDDDAAFLKSVLPLVVKGFGSVKNLLKDVFPELTDDELKRVKVKEIVPLILNIVKFSFTEIGSISTGKN